MKKKIIFTMYNLDLGGIETAMINILKNFDYSKYDVTILVEKKEGIFLSDVPKDVKIIDYNLCDSKNIIFRKVINRLKLIFFIIRNYKKYDCGCCYASHRKVGSILAPLISKNNILWIHGNYWKENSKEEFKQFFTDFNVKKYNNIVFVSNALKNKFIKQYKKKDKKLYVLNNLVNYKEMLELSNKEKIKKNKLTFINVGRHTEEEKNLSMLFKVCKKLIDEKYDFDLFMIGDGKDHNYYKDLVKELGIDKNIKFVGKKKNPFVYYKIADALLLTSKYEGNPVVFLESKVFSVPIITTDVSDAMIDINGKYGIVSKNDLNSFYKSLKSFLDNGFEIKEKFNTEKYNKNILENIYKIIDKED